MSTKIGQKVFQSHIKQFGVCALKRLNLPSSYKGQVTLEYTCSALREEVLNANDNVSMVNLPLI